MSCKDCRGPLGFSGRVDQVRRLYNPTVSILEKRRSDFCKNKLKGGCCGGGGQKKPLGCGMRNNLKFDCYPKPDLCRRWKSYWNKGCDSSLIRLYEDQPWFRDPTVQNEWQGFCDQIVTPANICYKMQPSGDQYSYDCQKVRALMGPQTYCTWDLPPPEEWYVVNRSFYNI